jgi:two-component system OmpR family response regulator
MRVLVVEDAPKMAELIRRGLVEQGLTVDVAGTGEDALVRAGACRYDAIVLDVILPGIDGFVTCRRLRAQAVSAPILMLTARDSLEDRVAGLDGGADDYLVKPFSFAELLARLRALSRRGGGAQIKVMRVGDLRLDPISRTASRGDTAIELSTKEFQLLATLMRHAGKVLTRVQLIEHVWRDSFEHRSNIVDVYVGYLRKKVDEPFGVRSIETLRGAGYRMRKDGGR